MKKISFLFAFILVLFLSSCAKKGRPSGGPKDEEAPLFVTANPPYETINFDTDEIKLYFNEYVKLKDLNKQLVISPPLNPSYPPLISPQGTASKYITIKILDTLQTNTTYTFDFGNSIEDNNESNVLERFKYVFSTGTYIDSLSLKGSVKNSYLSEDVKDIKMLLYKLDTSYTDSIVYKEKPSYVASTLDSSNYKFTNLKSGKYLLLAIEDAASDYLFDPKRDKIGFYKDTIQLPKDSVLTTPISLFREVLPYKFLRGKELKKGQLTFGYEGNADSLKIEVLSEVPDDFRMISIKEKNKDTINTWHTLVEKDSLLFKLTNGKDIDTAKVFLRKKKLDSLELSVSVAGTLNHLDTLFFSSNHPIVKVDTSKISFLDIDTLRVPYATFISKKDNQVGILFEKKLSSSYRIDAFPGAFTDLFNQENDTLKASFRTKSLEDYGDIIISVLNAKSIPVIIQITDTKDKTIVQKKVYESSTVLFQFLPPKDYKIRIIYDTNDNGKWDTGNFLSRTKPELVEYHPETQSVRANWSLNASIVIKQ